MRSPPLARARVAPKAFLGAAAAAGLLGAWLMVILATSTPSLGVRFGAPEHGPGLLVARVHEKGPSFGLLEPGDRVVGLALPEGRTLPLTAETLIEEPDFLPSYARLRAFFAEQGRLHRALAAPQVELVLQDGGVRVVHPRGRSASWLPPVFWFQLACGFIALVTGAAVVALRRRQRPAQLYALTGLSFAIITYPAAVYSSRELALPDTTFRWLAAADHLGAMSFIATFLALLWNYPRRLGDLPVFRLLLSICGVLWVLDTAHRLPGPDFGIRIPYFVVMITALLLGTVQWRKSARDPIGRAAIRWFLLSVLVGGSCFVIAIFVTVWIGREPLLSQGYAFGLVLSTYLGIALGITRYRLFQLEQWWVSLWLWAVAGACVVAVDLVLVQYLKLAHTPAAGISILLIGWVYFPARQWLVARLARRQQADLKWLLPETVKLVLGSSSAADLSRAFRGLLRRLFDPLEASDFPVQVSAAAIVEDGLALQVPGVAGQPPTLLRLAQRGHRLFTTHDRDVVQALHELVQYVLAQRDAYERGVQCERERLARDLHDDIGSRLLTLVHRAEPGSGIAELARDTLRELRTVISTLGAPPMRLSEFMADVRSETAERCEAAGVELEWTHEEPAEDLWLDAETRTNLLRVVREALSNALRHARPTRIAVNADTAHGMLVLSVSDDGRLPAPDTWSMGRGLSNIDRRIAELGGERALTRRNPTGTCLSLRVPLPDRGHP